MPGSRPDVGSSRNSSDGLVREFQGHADPLALAARQTVNGLVGALLEAQLADHLVDPGPALRLRGVLREAQLCGVREGFAHGQLRVQDVVLRDEADALAQFGVVTVEVAAVVQDRAAVGGTLTCQGVQERGLPGAARAHDGEQAFLADRKRHLVQECLTAVVDGDHEVLDVEGDLAGVDVLLQLVADEAERGVADADDVTGRDRRAGDGLAVEERAVVAAEVDDLVRPVRLGPQFRVPSRDDQVVDDQVVVSAAADADGPGGQRPYGGRPAERAGGQGQGHGRGTFRGPVDEFRPGAVGGVAEADDGAWAYAPLMDALAVGVRAVRAVLVLDGPVVGVGAQYRVVPGDPGVVDDDIAQWVASDVVVAAGAHHREARLGFEDEFGSDGRDRPLCHV